MKASTTKAWALAATALGLIQAMPAYAEQAGDSPASDIVVTARRVEERLQDVPISITVYNQQQLADRNIVNSGDLAAYTPSLAVNGKYGPEKASFAIRGFSQDLNTLPTVGVYLADVVAPRLSSNITSGNGAGVGSIFDLQNIQVLKGPQGTLFGRNTTGGAILLVPQRPTDRLAGYVEGSYGNYNLRRIQAVLNVPLSDTFMVRAGVDRYQRDGYINNRSGIGPSKLSDVNYFAARVSVLAQLTPDLENYTIATYSRSYTIGTLGRMAVCDPTSTSLLRAGVCAQLARETAAGFGYYDVENTIPDPFVRSRTWQVINTTTWKASDTLTVKNIASYGEAKESYSFNLAGDFTAFPFVTVYPGPHGGQGSQSTVTEEFQLQGRTSNSRLTWQAGAYLEHSSPLNLQTQYTAIYGGCSNIYAFQCSPFSLFGGRFIVGQVGVAHNQYFYHNYGLYAQGTYKLTDKFSLTAGIRNTWDWEQENANNIKIVPFVDGSGPKTYSCSRAVTPAGADVSLLSSGVCGNGRSFVQKSQKPTWLVDLDYKPAKDILFYAKYARGYRGGGINEANVGAETWNPETVDDYELGIKTSWRGEKVRGTLDIDGFWNDFKNQQASVFIPQCTAANAGCTNPAPTGINGIQNVGKSRLKGIEADGSITLFDNHLRFDIGYAYLDAKVIGGSVPFCDNTRFLCAQASFLTPGSILPYAPKNRITVTGTYTLPLAANIGQVSIGATFTHTDSQYTGHGDDAAFAAGNIPFNPGINPSTDLLNLNMNWKRVAGSPVDLSLFATNVTNQKYFVAGGGGLASTGGDAIILGEPRTYGARIKVSFGR